MRFFCLVPLVFFALIPPAAADWGYHDMRLEQGPRVSSMNTGGTGGHELYLECDTDPGGRLLMLLISDTPFPDQVEKSDPVQVSITVGGNAFTDLNASYGDYNGALSVDFSEENEARIRDVALSLLKAKGLIEITYPDGRSQFDTVGAKASVEPVLDLCPAR